MPQVERAHNSGATSTTLLAYRSTAGVFAVLVLVQAALAGQFMNGEGDLITVHRVLGTQVLPLLSLVIVVLAVMLRRGFSSGRFLVVPISLFVMTTLQTGLGYMGRDTQGAARWHIPLGVAIFGLAVYAVSAVRALPGDQP